jgi:hypothetical protein
MSKNSGDITVAKVIEFYIRAASASQCDGLRRNYAEGDRVLRPAEEDGLRPGSDPGRSAAAEIRTRWSRTKRKFISQLPFAFLKVDE